MTRTCAHCHVEKHLSEYYTSVPYVCKPCHNNRGKAWAKANPDIRRERNWKNKYGINFDMIRYRKLHELQEGLCKVCGREEPSGRMLAVDHDHDTGEIRGLLCTKCNTTLGWLEQYRTQFNNYLKGCDLLDGSDVFDGGRRTEGVLKGGSPADLE